MAKVSGIYLVNDEDFSDIIIADGLDVTRNDLHSNDSGRNPLTGQMWYRIITTKFTYDLVIGSGVPQERIVEHTNSISANGRRNKYSIWTPQIGDMYTFTGYINQLKIGVHHFYYNLSHQVRANIKSFPINIVEV